MRTIIVGGPMTGKSTLARQLADQDLAPIYCTDPRSTVRHRDPQVTYLPEHIGWTDSSRYIATNWFTRRGPWIVEGHAAARAIRTWLALYPDEDPADRILVMPEVPPAGAERSAGQEALARGVMAVWDQIAARVAGITEFVASDPQPQGQPEQFAAIGDLGKLIFEHPWT